MDSQRENKNKCRDILIKDVKTEHRNGIPWWTSTKKFSMLQKEK